MSLEQVIATYSAEKAEINKACILIKIYRSFIFFMLAVELYDATRSAWVVGNRIFDAPICNYRLPRDSSGSI
jgi:hypothetical protein